MNNEEKLIEVISEVHEMRLEIKGMREEIKGLRDDFNKKIVTLEDPQSKNQCGHW